MVKTIFIESCRFLCPSFFVVRVIHFPINSFSSRCFHMFSVYFCSRLHVSFSPCDQTFQIPQDISHPGFSATIASGQPLPLLPRNFRNVSSTSTILCDSPWCGAMAAVGQQNSKTPRSRGVASRQLQHFASRNNAWLHRNLRNFIKKGMTNHCIYQFQSLSIAIPETHEPCTFQKKPIR